MNLTSCDLVSTLPSERTSVCQRRKEPESEPLRCSAANIEQANGKARNGLRRRRDISVSHANKEAESEQLEAKVASGFRTSWERKEAQNKQLRSRKLENEQLWRKAASGLHRKEAQNEQLRNGEANIELQKYKKSTKAAQRVLPAGALCSETSVLFRKEARMEQLEHREAESEQLVLVSSALVLFAKEEEMEQIRRKAAKLEQSENNGKRRDLLLFHQNPLPQFLKSSRNRAGGVKGSCFGAADYDIQSYVLRHGGGVS